MKKDIIQELAKKAGLTVDADGEIGPTFYGSVSDGYVKFAEIIIKECGGIYDKIDNGNQHLGTTDYLKALALHFGKIK